MGEQMDFTTARRTIMVRSVAAALFAAAFVALYVLAVRTETGQRWDAASLGAFSELRGDSFAALYGTREWLPFAVLALAGAAGVEALLRRRWESLVCGGAMLALVGVGSMLLKQRLLPRPYLGEYAYTYMTFPSGHTAVTLAAVVAIVWFAPRWLHRLVVVVLGVVVVFVAAICVLSFAHRASDVIGGVLMVGAAAYGVLAASRAPHVRMRALGTTVALLGALAVVVALGLVVSARAAEDSGVSPSEVIGLATLVSTCGLTVLVLVGQSPIPGSRKQLGARQVPYVGRNSSLGSGGAESPTSVGNSSVASQGQQ